MRRFSFLKVADQAHRRTKTFRKWRIVRVTRVYLQLADCTLHTGRSLCSGRVRTTMGAAAYTSAQGVTTSLLVKPKVKLKVKLIVVSQVNLHVVVRDWFCVCDSFVNVFWLIDWSIDWLLCAAGCQHVLNNHAVQRLPDSDAEWQGLSWLALCHQPTARRTDQVRIYIEQHFNRVTVAVDCVLLVETNSWLQLAAPFPRH